MGMKRKVGLFLSRRDGRGQPGGDDRRLAGDVPAGLPEAGRRDPPDRGQPLRPLRRLRRPCCAPSTSGSRPTWTRCCREIAAEFESLGRKPQDLSRGRARRARQEVRHPAHLLHRPLAQGLPDQPAYRHEPRLPRGYVHALPRLGVRRRQGHERRHRPVAASPARCGPTATSVPRGRTTSSRSRPTCATSLAESDFGWMSEFFFEDFFTDRGALQSLRQGRRHLPDQRRRHLVAASPRQEARSGARRAIVQKPSRGGGSATTGATSPSTAARRPGRDRRQHPVVSKFVIREITYDTGLAREAVLQVFVARWSCWRCCCRWCSGSPRGCCRSNSSIRCSTCAARPAPSPRATSTRRSPTPTAATRSASSPRASPRCATRCARPSSISRKPTSRSSASCRTPSWRSSASRRSSTSSWATTSART